MGSIAEQSVLVVDTPQIVNGAPIKMIAKRYVPRSRTPQNGMTLLFAHGGAAHKEIWEPVIELLFQFHDTHKKPFLCEVWSLDWPTHGESAVLNHSALQDPNVVISKEWAVAMAAFCQSHLLSHRVVCIGHCAGAYTLLNSTRAFQEGSIRPYELMILVEPGIIHRHVFQAHSHHREGQLNDGAEWMKKRHREWESRDEAFSWLKERTPWSSWDPRVLRVFTEYGLCPIGDSENRVTLSSPPHIEARNFTEVEQTIQGMEQLELLCSRAPIHVLFGEYNDVIPDYYNDCVSHLENGRNVASVTVIPEVGHIIPQEKPDSLANYLWRILSQHVFQSDESHAEFKQVKVRL